MKKKFVIIDGNALIHRGFHAIRPLFTKSGEMTNAVYGFTTVLLGVLKKEKPDYIAVTFDKKGPTHRHVAFKDYKATRIKAPDELYGQIPRIKSIVTALNMPIFEMDGFEADDVIASLVAKTEDAGLDTVIVTGDKDTLQLVSDHVTVASPVKGYNEVFYYTPQSVVEKLGVTPKQVIDYKALCGDSSDNIPGVHGIGPKTCVELLGKYGTLESIYDHLSEISGKVKDKLEKNKESAFFSKMLVRLVSDMAFDFELEKCHVGDFANDKILGIFEELEFKSLASRLKELKQPEPIDSQMSLIF